MQVAAGHLERVGISDAALIDLYYRLGGSCVGLTILKQVADRCNLIVPDDLIMDLEDAARLGADRLVGSLPLGLRSGFALKYSGHQESFSPGCTRGRYSSRRRFWDGTDLDQARILVAEAITHAPPGTCSLMFQQYVKAEGLSGVFYAYGYPGRVLVEAVSRGRRTYTDIRGGQVVERATVKGEHIRSGSTLQANPFQLYQSISGLRRVVGFDLDMEGFVASTGVIAVQLRPIPDDMPRLPRPPSRLPAGGGWHRTPWVWGTWPGWAATVDEDLSGHPSVMVKRATSLADCPLIMARLRRGDSTLVVDPVDGFRLSHDPRHLPEVIPYRKSFAFISVAGSHLAALQPGDTIEAFIDGDAGMIRRANAALHN
ncbi:hypothetical protein ACPCTO_31975 [Streptomyces olivoreticuli]